eukprot:SM000111S18826  [mRNA]  locus=s111:288299:290780:- [translate_table: standard]
MLRGRCIHSGHPLSTCCSHHHHHPSRSACAAPWLLHCGGRLWGASLIVKPVRPRELVSHSAAALEVATMERVFLSPQPPPPLLPLMGSCSRTHGAAALPPRLSRQRRRAEASAVAGAMGACVAMAHLRQCHTALAAPASRTRTPPEAGHSRRRPVLRRAGQQDPFPKDELHCAPPPRPWLPAPAVQAGLWALLGVYTLWLLVLPYAPGNPAWATTPETIDSLKGLSLNFFFVLPAANWVGLHALEAPVLHPVDEGLFNFVNAWSLMFGPLIFKDKRRGASRGLTQSLWIGQMFLTNLFLIPYMALRLNKPEPASQSESVSPLVALGQAVASQSTTIGLVGGVIGIISVTWAIFLRSSEQFGGPAERLSYFLEYLATDRVAYAFIWDLVLYSLFQAWLVLDFIESLPAANDQRLWRRVGCVPYLGLAAILIARRETTK